MRPKATSRTTYAVVGMTAILSFSCASLNCTERPDPGAQNVAAVEPPWRPGIVYVEGPHLMLEGQRYRFIGVNMYSLPAVPANQKGYHCGNGFTDKEAQAAMKEVADMGGRVIRVPAYQSATKGGKNFARLDLIVDTAEALGQKLVVVLENQWEHCTEGGYKYNTWYRGKYRKAYGDYKLSYTEYVKLVLARYQNRPGILMWQLMNEAETVSTADTADPAAMLDFTRTMAAVAKRADPHHLVSLGTEGVLKPSSGGPFYGLVNDIPGVDVVEAHDYAEPEIGMPPAISIARTVARELGKPFFIGEVGISSPPYSKNKRAHHLGHKLQAAWEDDVEGVLIWSYRSIDGTKKHFGPKDPLVKTLRTFATLRGILPTPPPPPIIELHPIPAPAPRETMGPPLPPQ